MRIHPRLASLLVTVILLPIFYFLYKLFDFNIIVLIVFIILDCIISTIVYSHLVDKYDDDDDGR